MNKQNRGGVGVKAGEKEKSQVGGRLTESVVSIVFVCEIG